METRVEAAFADGEYVFWLPLPQIFELERGCGSMLAIEERLRAGIGIDEGEEVVFTGGGSSTVKEVREVIRLALIGGNRGMVDGEEIEIGPLEAKRLVDGYCYPARPMVESAALAWRILSGAIYGVRLKKSERGAGRREREPFPKGQLIANCGAMGLDWRHLSLGAYLEALEAHNETQGGEKEPARASEGLMRFMKAHRDGGNRGGSGAVTKGEGAPGG